jgi:hypothetical protein
MYNKDAHLSQMMRETLRILEDTLATRCMFWTVFEDEEEFNLGD